MATERKGLAGADGRPALHVYPFGKVPRGGRKVTTWRRAGDDGPAHVIGRWQQIALRDGLRLVAHKTREQAENA